MIQPRGNWLTDQRCADGPGGPFPMDTYHSHADAKMEALKALIAFLIVSIGVYLGFKQVAPPDSLSADASPQVFSSGRAVKHLRAIAQRLLGAKAFVDAHPTAKEVKVALNFEARGNGGPSIMFETSPDNGWLIGALRKRLHIRSPIHFQRRYTGACRMTPT